MNKQIVVFGTGYVGLSNAILLAQNNSVVAVDINSEKVRKINQRKSPIRDSEIEHYLKHSKLDLSAKLDASNEVKTADFIVIATPTDYDEELKFFDTSSVENVIDAVRRINKFVPIVIKSTIPLGFITELKSKGFNQVFFVPEFLREGKALYDNLFPSRIVIGDKSSAAKEFASLLLEGAIKKDINVLYTDPTEAEAIKLFANTYLAMRVAFFNELDTYAMGHGLKSKEIIKGVCLDPRIGDFYNNPSFGYGGYCLPKDTKQLLANYEGIPETLITAIVKANGIRKDVIAQTVLKRNPKIVGLYRLTIKSGSDNFRASAIFDISKSLLAKGIQIVVYEPSILSQEFLGMPILNDFSLFAEKVDVILANRFDEKLSVVSEKVISRDIFHNN